MKLLSSCPLYSSFFSHSQELCSKMVIPAEQLKFQLTEEEVGLEAVYMRK